MGDQGEQEFGLGARVGFGPAVGDENAVRGGLDADSDARDITEAAPGGGAYLRQPDVDRVVRHPPRGVGFARATWHGLLLRCETRRRPVLRMPPGHQPADLDGEGAPVVLDERAMIRCQRIEKILFTWYFAGTHLVRGNVAAVATAAVATRDGDRGQHSRREELGIAQVVQFDRRQLTQQQPPDVRTRLSGQESIGAQQAEHAPGRQQPWQRRDERMRQIDPSTQPETLAQQLGRRSAQLLGPHVRGLVITASNEPSASSASTAIKSATCQSTTIPAAPARSRATASASPSRS